MHLFNPFRAPEPLPILNPSNFVPKIGFPVVKGLRYTWLVAVNTDEKHNKTSYIYVCTSGTKYTSSS